MDFLIELIGQVHVWFNWYCDFDDAMETVTLGANFRTSCIVKNTDEMSLDFKAYSVSNEPPRLDSCGNLSSLGKIMTSLQVEIPALISASLDLDSPFTQYT